MNRSSVCVAAIAATTLFFTGSAVRADDDRAEKLVDAKSVLQELLTAPDRGVPQDLSKDCKCIAVIPGVVKAALGYGARHGSGVMSCRHAGGWSAPTFINLTGGSVGLQIGVEKTDLVLFFMSEKGARSLSSSKFTLGAKAGVAAGPLGRTGEASTDVKLNAEIYSYAKSKGVFAGISLEGARLAPDNKDNAKYYGKSVTGKELLFGHPDVNVPSEAEEFRKSLP